MKNTITEMKNTLEGINSRLDEAEDEISNLEDKVAENTQSEQQKRIFKNEDSLRNLWNQHQASDICIIGVPEGEEREQGIENLFEKIMTNKTLLMWQRK